MNDFGFKYQIGDYVQTIVTIPYQLASDHAFRFTAHGQRMRLLIVERILHETPGGIGRKYVCRGMNERGGVSVFKDDPYITFHEMELTAFVPDCIPN